MSPIVDPELRRRRGTSHVTYRDQGTVVCGQRDALACYLAWDRAIPSRRSRDSDPYSALYLHANRKRCAMGSSFGQLFRITTWGESHGGGVGVVIDGCPPRLELSEEDIQRELDRRRPGQSEIVTPRDEADRCRILSGVFEGRTLGTPISILVKNKDAQPEAYSEMQRRLPAIARRLHLRSEVRHPKLAGRRPRFRARNDWARRGRRGCEKAPGQTLAGTFRNCRLRDANSRSRGTNRSKLRPS